MNIRVLSILAALFLFPLVSNAQQCQSESCGNQSQNVPLPTPTCGVNCGNGVCNTNENENFGTCPQDCHCGDGVCSSAYNENHSNCARDCGSDSVVCGDGVCSFSSGENSANCPRDCGGATPTPTVTPPPNPTPTPTATPTTTPTTSSVNCGDGVCSSSLGENTRT
ncbi:MAG: hypothetical protein KBC84_07165, partial [Proteobacteria bacterium]|nr:hypothetical protein [Pseudomonadota bacterium]